jgi:hypothetical protein
MQDKIKNFPSGVSQEKPESDDPLPFPEPPVKDRRAVSFPDPPLEDDPLSFPEPPVKD